MHAHTLIEPLENRQLLAAGNLGFAFSLGGANDEYLYAQATDAAGNCYVAGLIVGGASVDFNPSPRRSHIITVEEGYSTRFLAKYSAKGALAWVRSIDEHIDIGALAIDRASGDLLVGGYYSSSGGPLTFAPGITLFYNLEANAGYWGRINPNTGVFTAATHALSGMGCSVTEIASDAAGNVYLAGSHGAYPMYPSNWACIEKFNAKGRCLWTRSYRPVDSGGASDPDQDNYDAPRCMAVTPAGQVYFAGQNRSDRASDLGLSAKGWYLCSLSASTGAKIFGDTLITGTASGEAIHDLAVDAGGNVLVVGAFTSSTDFNISATGAAVPLAAIGGHTDGFLARYDPVGHLQFVRQIGLDEDLGQGDVATSVTIDAEGYIYVGGSTWGTTWFNDSFRFRSGASNRDAFIAKYKARGTFMTAWLLGGGSAADEVAFLSTGPGNALYATGLLHGPFDADPEKAILTLSPVKDPDIFVVKLV